jgi:hypothetical protein
MAGDVVTECFDPDHFEVIDGKLTPAPWMQLRNVGSISAPTKAASYAVSRGGNKTVLLHSLDLKWRNDSPIDQWVYGMVTRGGSRVTLQARSRAYLRTDTGYALGLAPGPMTPVSYHGTGADTGVGGVLAVGTQFTVIENRANTVTFPLAAEKTGWLLVPAGDTVSARTQVWFISEFWEFGSVNGGTAGCESSFESGGTRMDLFALPDIPEL